MAILKLQLIGVVIFLVSALEAQEKPVNESVTTTSAATGSPGSTSADSTTEASSGSSSTAPASVLNDGNPSTSSIPTTPNTTDQHGTAGNGSQENGGYPFVKPGKHRPGLRHVKGHDGFHSLRTEKNWAHWNDNFTTALP